MEVWKVIFLYKWVICRFHVNLPGCTAALSKKGVCFYKMWVKQHLKMPSGVVGAPTTPLTFDHLLWKKCILRISKNSSRFALSPARDMRKKNCWGREIIEHLIWDYLKNTTHLGLLTHSLECHVGNLGSMVRINGLFHLLLVDGFKPSEKYARQIGASLQGSGMTKPPLS